METMPDVTRFFHPLLASRRLKTKPLRVVLAGRNYALFRDRQGRAAALADTCPHRFAPLSEGRVRTDGRLACPYHGWHFDAEGKGCNPSQPTLAKCDVRSFQVVERHGYLWMAERETPLSAFPEMDWEGFEFSSSFDYLFRAPLHVSLANFTENEHVPYVHTRLGWEESQVDGVGFSADNFPDRSEVFYKGPQRPSPYIKLLGLKAGDTYHNEWVSRFDPVRTLYTVSWSNRKTGKPRPFTLRAMIFMTPETERTTRFHVFIFLKLRQPALRYILPVVRKAAHILTWYEVDDDARFIPYIADTPQDLKGMRLDKFDKPVIHNLKLLRTLYFAEQRQDVKSGAAATTTESARTPERALQ